MVTSCTGQSTFNCRLDQLRKSSSTCSVTVEENEQVVQYALNKRPNVKLVSTGLTFGVEGFTHIMGKQFHPSMKETRRYYPHRYNVDGFFVAKFKKTGPTPANAVRVNGNATTPGNGVAVHEIIDKTPVTDENEDDDFGGWDDEEDDEYMERAKRAALRKKGINPKAALDGKKPDKVVKQDAAKRTKKVRVQAPDEEDGSVPTEKGSASDKKAGEDEEGKISFTGHGGARLLDQKEIHRKARKRIPSRPKP